MLFLIIGLFVVILIFVLAFSSNKKVVRVTTVDAKTGKEEKVEVREEEGASGSQTAARATLMLIFGVPLISAALYWGGAGVSAAVNGVSFYVYELNNPKPTLAQEVLEAEKQRDMAASEEVEMAEYNSLKEECVPFKPCTQFKTRTKVAEKYDAMRENNKKLKRAAREELEERIRDWELKWKRGQW